MGIQTIPLPYKHTLKQFGQNLQRLRKEKEISQEKLAEKVGVHRTYLSLVEQGQRNPSLKFVYRVTKALNTNSSKLLSF
ncbi:MAG: hypothetical protein A3H50_03525 [Candidatus Levybacteria bacterium RIFCSPLOWO2_02_FULL_37_10]|uniref:HTH cro/C1-type domain-containing protein n=1 Tax=Candidatus Wildermuthbacteria bacterium RIFCSPHIGHO2_12_FULL_40_12 TaxID=1802457 RepID=A0A1G2RF02_9BACT|nr:MAG: hypothetical protein A2860_02400 [Candidatus Levybacteria bacterium RIFCSPHIGHO2_01_FULL_37_33]OGH15807.1 MAG: hypothetical protein A3C97_01005 [Candidatus Levybacteria bacterium RIFCSPHIGHO2_02_FULL_37_11]OGH43128.1 MAG: hypothetical protein A3H50_03525 [Candidatus Levybacteria bacterium RIFCSPLOWO2_02_FULL_37_10]OHA70969.1 MAG: hypothetical protein A3F15_00280 [Candidatus Wildermuthbacteria bacterium RIFCSPHIGHO2_12_FULL_40_12]